MYKKEKKKKMFKTSESYIYDIRVRTSTIHFNLSVFLILCYVRPINIPNTHIQLLRYDMRNVFIIICKLAYKLYSNIAIAIIWLKQILLNSKCFFTKNS